MERRDSIYLFCVLSLVWFCFPPTLSLFNTSGGAVQFFIPNASTIPGIVNESSCIQNYS